MQKKPVSCLIYAYYLTSSALNWVTEWNVVCDLFKVIQPYTSTGFPFPLFIWTTFDTWKNGYKEQHIDYHVLIVTMKE